MGRIDVLAQPRHLPALARLATAIPTRPIVIDHRAKPVIAAGADPGADWFADMDRLTAHPQVFSKLSGLEDEAGPDRVMWGSDWPVLDLVGTYDRWVAATDVHFWAPDAAARFYGIEARRKPWPSVSRKAFTPATASVMSSLPPMPRSCSPPSITVTSIVP